MGRWVLDDYEFRGRASADRVECALAHVRPAFEGCPLDQVYRRACAYIRARQAERASLATIRLELAALGRELTLRARARDIPYRPFLPQIQVDNARSEFFEDQELDAVCRHLPEVLADLARLSAITGFRLREATGLTWREVDWPRMVIRLPRGRTKNRRGKVFPFRTCTELRRILERRRSAALGEYVFHRKGKPVRDLRGAWKKALQLSGNDGKWWHDLRRTSGRRLLLAGVPLSHRQLLLGIRTVEVLTGHYEPWLEKDLERSVERL